jgi:hypothetical protein
LVAVAGSKKNVFVCASPLFCCFDVKYPVRICQRKFLSASSLPFTLIFYFISGRKFYLNGSDRLGMLTYFPGNDIWLMQRPKTDMQPIGGTANSLVIARNGQIIFETVICK